MSICIWVWVSIFSLVVCRLIRCKFWGKIYQLVFVQCYFFLLWPTYGWPDMINRSMIWDLIFILTKMDKLKRSVINNWIIIVLDILNQLSLLCKMLNLVNSSYLYLGNNRSSSKFNDPFHILMNDLMIKSTLIEALVNNAHFVCLSLFVLNFSCWYYREHSRHFWLKTIFND